LLYDGETKERLAMAKINGGSKSGRMFDVNYGATPFRKRRIGRRQRLYLRDDGG
jgi:hypothetical protein